VTAGGAFISGARAAGASKPALWVVRAGSVVRELGTLAAANVPTVTAGGVTGRGSAGFGAISRRGSGTIGFGSTRAVGTGGTGRGGSLNAAIGSAGFGVTLRAGTSGTTNAGSGAGIALTNVSTRDARGIAVATVSRAKYNSGTMTATWSALLTATAVHERREGGAALKSCRTGGRWLTTDLRIGRC